VEVAARENPAIEYLGRRSSDEVAQLMGRAEFLVFPTECYEGMPRTVIESFAVGTPVVASNIGSTATMVVPGETGFHFTPGNVAELRERVEWCSRNLDQLRAMRSKARQAFESNYTGAANARMLVAIYERAQEAARQAPKR
jgi:glycosyltransferase involved in cell wall biosynthesis